MQSGTLVGAKSWGECWLHTALNSTCVLVVLISSQPPQGLICMLVVLNYKIIKLNLLLEKRTQFIFKEFYETPLNQGINLR
jgi:hypothetical protein